MTTETEKAEAFTRTRARMFPFLAVLFLAQQSLFIHWDGRAVTAVQTVVWLIMALALLAALYTGGAWFRSRAFTEIANDEVTKANRDMALRRGFLAAMLTAIFIFAAAPFEPLSAQRAAHLIVSIGIAIALIVFGLEERKAGE